MTPRSEALAPCMKKAAFSTSFSFGGPMEGLSDEGQDRLAQ